MTTTELSRFVRALACALEVAVMDHDQMARVVGLLGELAEAARRRRRTADRPDPGDAGRANQLRVLHAGLWLIHRPSTSAVLADALDRDPHEAGVLASALDRAAMELRRLHVAVQLEATRTSVSMLARRGRHRERPAS